MKKLLIAAAALAALPAFATTYNYTSTARNDFGTLYADTSLSIDNTAMTLTGSTVLSLGAVGNGVTLQCCSPASTYPTMALTLLPGSRGSGTYSYNIDLSMASSWDPTFLSSNGGTPASALTALLNGLNVDHVGAVKDWTSASNGAVGRLVAAPVPEPSTYAMLALGLGLVALRRRKQQA